MSKWCVSFFCWVYITTIVFNVYTFPVLSVNCHWMFKKPGNSWRGLHRKNEAFNTVDTGSKIR